jgi:hypothetical protein
VNATSATMASIRAATSGTTTLTPSGLFSSMIWDKCPQLRVEQALALVELAALRQLVGGLATPSALSGLSTGQCYILGTNNLGGNPPRVEP